jgi:hypothetical protein
VLKTVRGAMRDDPEINAVEFRSADSDRKGTKPAVCSGFHQWAEPGHYANRSETEVVAPALGF